jgi:hypothetical protein
MEKRAVEARDRLHEWFSPTEAVPWFYGREQELEKLQHSLESTGR